MRALNETRVATLERIVSAGGLLEANANLLNAMVEGLVEGYAMKSLKPIAPTMRPRNR